VAVTPDGRYVASASSDRTVKLWEVATKREVTTLFGHGQLVGAVALSANGRYLASGSDDRTVKLWRRRE
jgi:WD40 repeat protein